jgi:hypothetical protein
MKADSLRTQQAVARFGKSARHPLCLAALALWRVEDETSKYAEYAKCLGEDLLSMKRQKEQARALYERLYKEGKQKEAIRAAELLCKIGELRPELEKCYRANVKLFTIWYEHFYPAVLVRFEREYEAISRAKDTKATRALKRALQRVKKRWDGGARLKDGDVRELGLLQMHRDKVIKAAEAKDGGTAGYLEAARGGDRALSDEAWEGRLTARDIHSRLMAAEGSRVAGDKDAKEIRRLARKLGIRLAEDQRGRKWKPFRAKQEPKQQPRGRPRTNPWVEFTKNLAGVEAMQAKAGMIPKKRRFVRSPDLLWRPPAEKTPVKVLKQTLSAWRKLKTKKLSA